jgi:Restriction endonuclease
VVGSAHWPRGAGRDFQVSTDGEALGDKARNGRLLVVNDLPGNIAKLQGFRGTICRVQHDDLLKRVLDGTRSELAGAIGANRTRLAQTLREAITELHWKDFEILVDLVFRHTGWIRVSVLGQQAKGYDLELREPITGDRYVVQVKSSAGLKDLQNTVAGFSPKDYRLVFFVVHSPEPDLETIPEIPDHVELVPPLRLAELAIDAGLTTWLEHRIS